MTAMMSHDAFDMSLAGREQGAGISPQRSDLAIRMADVTIAALALLFFAPLIMVLAVIVYVTDPGPIFFGHRRLGKNGRSFKCYKIRSMVIDAEARLQDILRDDPVRRAEWERDHKLAQDPRVTKIGRFLRKSSLDELPQLWNVLRGDMSLVGPRPISAAETVRYGRYIANYYATRPGITGLWQVSGRSDTTYLRRVAMDVKYSRSQSFMLYLRILFATVPAVVLAQGSY